MWNFFTSDSDGDSPFQNRLQPIVDDLFSIPASWTIGVAIATVVSTFEVTWSEQALTINYQITSTTVWLAALVWLPVLLRMLALFGGGVKAGGNEVQFAGLLSVLDDNLGALAYLQRNASRNDVELLRVDETLREVEDALSQTVPDRKAARSKLRELSSKYEEIRDTMESSPRRTSLLEKLVAQVRAFAQRADFTTTELREVFKGESTGDRIVVLGILQRIPKRELFDLVFSAIRDSQSGFEQYHALRAAQSLLERLSAKEKRRLKELIEERLSDPGSYIAQSTDRKTVSEQILSTLENDV